MSAMVKNGDLVPDAAGTITKQQTFDALMHVGVSRRVAEETTNANFDHLPWWSRRLNVFRMNTVNNHGPSDPPGALEHFRSTGIRDGGNNPQPDVLRYSEFHNCAGWDRLPADFSLAGERRPRKGVWAVLWAARRWLRRVLHLMRTGPFPKPQQICPARRHTSLRGPYLGSRADLPGLRFSPRPAPE